MLVAAVSLAATVGPSWAAQPAAVGTGVAPPCDRACMIALVDRYFAALVRHDPTGLPLNRDVKFTENDARLKVGTEGLWVAASEVPVGFHFTAVDVGAGQVG